MKKRLISLIVVAVFCALLMPNLSACSIGVEDLAGYVASIENASAVGIGKMSVTKNSVKARANTQAGVIAVPVALDNVSAEQTKDYLLTATETEDGYEYEKLSFTKIENNLFGEVKGEKEYVSADGTLSFFANKGFKYTVLVDGEEVFSEIEDNFAEDENKKQGVITLSGFEEGKTYVVRHRGKGKEKVLTQDEMKAHISRVYVSGNFTFVVFVGKDGYDDYSGGYNWRFGGKFHDTEESRCKSFVIDNESGRVYSLKDTYVQRTYDGMVIVEKENENGGVNQPLLYDVSVNENDELVFTPIITNENLRVGEFFKDKYGRKYIQVDNMQLDGYYDEKTNALFWGFDTVNWEKGENDYHKNSKGEAVRVEKAEIKVVVKKKWNEQWHEYETTQKIDKLYVLDENGKERELNEKDSFYLLNSEYFWDKECNHIAVENGWIKEGGFTLYNYLSEKNVKYYEYSCPYKTVQAINSEATGYDSPLFDDGVLFVMRDGDLCYSENIWECMKKQIEVEYKTILSGCIYDGYNENLGQIVFKKAGINGEVYYTVKETIVGGERTYEAVEAGSYEGIATSFTLQPLNR